MACLGLLAPAGAGHAVAEGPGWYGSAGYGHTSFETSQLDVQVGAIEARIGYQFPGWFGIEAEAAFGVSDYSVTGGGSNRILIELDHSAGAFAVARVPVGSRAAFRARLGYRESRFTLDTRSPGDPPFRQSASDGGVVVGIGGEYAFGDLGLRADYSRAIDATPFRDVDHTDTLSISIVKRF